MTSFLDLSTSMTLNPPRKKRFSVNFSQFLDAAHISTLNCDKMAGHRPRQRKSSALNVDFSSPSPDPLGSSLQCEPIQLAAKTVE